MFFLIIILTNCLAQVFLKFISIIVIIVNIYYINIEWHIYNYLIAKCVNI